MMNPERFSAEEATPPGSGYEELGRFFAQTLARFQRGLAPVDTAARAVADVVEDPSPPLRTIVPVEFAGLADRGDSIRDDDYWRICHATSDEEYVGALRDALRATGGSHTSGAPRPSDQ
jgi:hypothetical protein